MADVFDAELAAEDRAIPAGWSSVTVHECFCKRPPYANDGGHVHLPDYAQVHDGPGAGNRTVAVPPYMIRAGRVSERAVREHFRGRRWRGSYQSRTWDRPGSLTRFREQEKRAREVLAYGHA